MATRKQIRQQKLSWALKICTGFHMAGQHFIPDYIRSKSHMLGLLGQVISEIRFELRNIP